VAVATSNDGKMGIWMTSALVVGTIIGAAIFMLPVRVLRARPRTEATARDMSSSPTWPGLAATFPRGVDVPAPQYSHYMPMEDPAFIAAQVRELLAQREH